MAEVVTVSTGGRIVTDDEPLVSVECNPGSERLAKFVEDQINGLRGEGREAFIRAIHYGAVDLMMNGFTPEVSPTLRIKSP